MDFHEKLGKLLSQYLSSEERTEQIPSSVVDAYHKLGLTEYASRNTVNEVYAEINNNLQTDLIHSSSKFARDYEVQQQQDIDAAYKVICNWLDAHT